MKPPESHIKFYQSRCPALNFDQWDWSGDQSFLTPKAMYLMRTIRFHGIESEKTASIYVYYRNNGQRCWFTVTLRGLNYPSFVYNQDVEIDAYKATSEELFAQVDKQAKEMLLTNLDAILAKEQEWIDEFNRKQKTGW